MAQLIVPGITFETHIDFKIVAVCEIIKLTGSKVFLRRFIHPGNVNDKMFKFFQNVLRLLGKLSIMEVRFSPSSEGVVILISGAYTKRI